MTLRKPAKRATSGGNVPIDTLTEKAVLGMMIGTADDGAHVVKPMMELLRPSSFGDIRHRAIFEAMQTALDAGLTCDTVTVQSELAKRDQIQNVGGIDYLMQIARDALPRANFYQHARALAKLEALRLALDECDGLRKIITSADHDKALAVIRDAQERFRFFDTLASGTHADNSIVRADPEPWPEAVMTAALLNEIVSIYQRFVILPDHAAEVLALWILHSYVFEHGEISPIIALISPEKRCGKSTALHLADSLTHCALVTSNVTARGLHPAMAKEFRRTISPNF